MADHDLYAILGLESRDADAATIKRAYLKVARDVHPDRNPGDESANEKFQAVGRAYAILRDPEKRKLYDASGLVDDGPTVGEKQWYDFWRDFYSRVTTDKLDALAAEYRNSAEEEEDLKAAYRETKGNVGGILDRIMHSTADDEPRFREKLDAWIAAGVLPAFKGYSSEPDAKKRRRQAKAAKEAEEAEELARTLGVGGGSGDLASAIIARQQNRSSGFDAMLGGLAEKYGADAGNKGGKSKAGGGNKGKGRGKAAASSAEEDPLDDDAFAALQAKMMAKKR